MGRGRAPDRWRFWQDLLEEQRRSGESIAGFCRERDVSPASFYNWRRKLAQEGADKFIAVELPPVATMACCEVVLPNGCRVIVPPGHDANSLRSILAILGEEASTC